MIRINTWLRDERAQIETAMTKAGDEPDQDRPFDPLRALIFFGVGTILALSIAAFCASAL